MEDMKEFEKELMVEDSENILNTYKRFPVVLKEGKGATLKDYKGKEYIDFSSGIGTNSFGACDKEWVDAVVHQANTLQHSSNLYYTAPQVMVAKMLCRKTNMKKVFFGNSGAEANEGAIKVARKYAHTISPDKSQIITALHSFHGRTLATLTATGQPKYQEGFGPLPAGFDYVEYNNIEALEKMMSENTAAVMLEPIQGEGGVHVPTAEYLKKVRALCDKYNAVLIFDEIQTGIGRSGEFFAYDKFGVKPDVVTLAKGLAGGVPIGAFITSDKIADVLHAGDHGSTFGGNPLACAAADVVLATVGNEAFLKHVEEMGDYMKSRLEAIKAKFPTLVKEVRGVGLILGMEINKPGRDIVNACLEKGSIINCTAGNVLRFVPPLIVEKEHIDEVCDILEAVLPAYVD